MKPSMDCTPEKLCNEYIYTVFKKKKNEYVEKANHYMAAKILCLDRPAVRYFSIYDKTILNF